MLSYEEEKEETEEMSTSKHWWYWGKCEKDMIALRWNEWKIKRKKLMNEWGNEWMNASIN